MTVQILFAHLLDNTRCRPVRVLCDILEASLYKFYNQFYMCNV